MEREICVDKPPEVKQRRCLRCRKLRRATSFKKSYQNAPCKFCRESIQGLIIKNDVDCKCFLCGAIYKSTYFRGFCKTCKTSEGYKLNNAF